MLCCVSKSSSEGYVVHCVRVVIVCVTAERLGSGVNNRARVLRLQSASDHRGLRLRQPQSHAQGQTARYVTAGVQTRTVVSPCVCKHALM